MRRPPHVPIRTCVVCRTPGDKRGLLRVVRTAEAGTAFDVTGKASGRGAYVCAAAACIELARKQKRLDRSLKATVGAEVFDALLAQVTPPEGQ